MHRLQYFNLSPFEIPEGQIFPGLTFHIPQPEVLTKGHPPSGASSYGPLQGVRPGHLAKMILLEIVLSDRLTAQS